MSWIDITWPLDACAPAYAPEEGFSCERVKSMPEHEYNLSRFSMGAHCGTHIDAPRHFLEDGATAEAAPLEILNGPALVIGVEGGFRPESVMDGCERVLMRGEFLGLSREDAEMLLSKGVRLVGTSGLSIGRPESEMPPHAALLGGGAWILENLRLEGVEDGWYDLSCLPLPLVGLEAAPARAALRGPRSRGR